MQKNNSTLELAIVIPAYKVTYLKETLEALTLQTNKNFIVYVGDDASPFNIESVVSLFQQKLSLVYHRFSQNIGGVSLVQQWHRCIGLTKNEPWIWVLCDDDVPSNNCVEEFYKLLNTQKLFAAARFCNVQINGNGKLIKRPTKNPLHETGYEFMFRKFFGFTRSSLSEYVFSRAYFNTVGGFPDFAAAWSSDDAFWLLLGNIGGLVSTNKATLFMRMSGENISSIETDSSLTEKKLGSQQFNNWLQTNHQQFYEKIQPKRIWFEQVKHFCTQKPIGIFGVLQLLCAPGIDGKLRIRAFTLLLAFVRKQMATR